MNTVDRYGVGTLVTKQIIDSERKKNKTKKKHKST